MARIGLSDLALKDGGLAVGAAAVLALGVISATKAPPALATYGLLSLGSGPFDGSTSGKFVGHASGTVIAVNAASGYAGNLLDVQVAGSSKVSVSAGGVVAAAGLTATFAQSNSTWLIGSNVSGGTSATIGLRLDTNAGTTRGYIAHTGGGYTTSGLLVADQMSMVGAGAKGILLHANNAAGTVTLATNGTAAVVVAADRNVLLSTAPVGTANYGLLNLGSGPFDGSTAGKFVGSASGTLLAGNAASGFAGNLLDLQVAGVSQLTLSAGGVLRAGTVTGNVVSLTPAAAGVAPSVGIGAASADANVDLTLASKGTGVVKTSGAFRIGTRPAFVAADKYLVVDAAGNVHVSALGPAS